jgi:hypothetical protein
MSTDLDPDIAARFADLDRVPVPDVWSRVQARRQAMPIGLTPPPRRRWTVAAAAILIVAGIGALVLVVSRDRTGAPPSASTPSAEPYGDARIEPSVVAPGGTITVTPTAVVDRFCRDEAFVYPDGIGRPERRIEITTTGGWVAEATAQTLTACFQLPSAKSVSYVIAPQATPGRYVLCLSSAPSEAACGTLVIGDGSTLPPATTLPSTTPIFGAATVTPSTVRLGESFTVTPAGVVAVPCDGDVAVLAGSADALGLVGLVDDSTRLRRDDRRDDCGGVSSGAAQQHVLPTDLQPGSYVVCITVEVVASGCGTLHVEAAGASSTVVSPSTVTDDLLSVWPSAPDLGGRRSLDDVPRLLPPPASPGIAATDVSRYDTLVGPGQEGVYVQTWVEPGRGRVLAIATRPGGTVGAAAGPGDVHVAPWDDATFAPVVDPEVVLDLSDPSGRATISAVGWTRDEVLGVASSLRLRAVGPGWDLGGASLPLQLVHEGWRLGGGARMVTWTRADVGPVARLQLLRGQPDMISHRGEPRRVVADEIGGRPALVTDWGDSVDVQWAASADSTADLHYVGAVDAAVAMARSLRPVDAATWDAIPPAVSDGCGDGPC